MEKNGKYHRIYIQWGWIPTSVQKLPEMSSKSETFCKPKRARKDLLNTNYFPPVLSMIFQALLEIAFLSFSR